MKKRLAVLFLGIIFTLSLISCSGGSKNTEMGRYLEEEYTVPENVQWITSMKVLDDDTVLMTGYGQESDLLVLSSTDGGKTWEEKEIKLPEEAGKELSINQSAISKDGRMFIEYCFYEMNQEEENLDGEPAVEEVPEGETATEEDQKYEISEEEHQKEYLDYLNSLKHAVIDKDGNITELDLSSVNEVKNSEDVYSAGLGQAVFADNGDLLLLYNYADVVQVDSTTGQVKNTFSNGEGDLNTFAVLGDSLIIATYESIKEYDLSSGSEKGNLKGLEEALGMNDENGSYDYYNTSYFAGKDENTLYYYNTNGLYKYDLKNDKTEQLIDGSLSSFGDNNMGIRYIQEKADNKFLAVYDSYGSDKSNSKVINYYYSADTPKVPDNELVVYSLYENYDIKQSIVLYQKSHPDVYIRTETGLTGDDAVTEADALRTLNTEIMAGNGPDIILLDGMDVDNYITKGLLADMSDGLAEYTKDNKLFTNIVDAYSKDGKIYAMPMNIQIPTIVGQKGTIESFSDLKGFTSMIEKISKDNPGQILDIIMPQQYAALMYNANGNAWFNEDGTINEENLKTFYEEAKKQYDIIKSTFDQNEYESYVNDMKSYFSEKEEELTEEDMDMSSYYVNYYLNVMSVASGNGSKLAIGNLSGMYDLQELYSVNKKKEIEYSVAKGQVSDVFVPSGLVGISSKSNEKEIAADFVKYLFSVESQSVDRYSGFPVNIDAFDKLSVYPYAEEEGYKEGQSIGGMGTTLEDGTEFYIDMYWPTKEYFEQVKEIISTVKNPSVADTQILRVITKQFEAYENGEVSVDQAVQNVLDQVNLYLSE